MSNIPYKSFNRNYKSPTAASKCLFCKVVVKANDSFRNVNPANGEVDYFHFNCFKKAVNNMIQGLKDESKHGEKDSK